MINKKIAKIFYETAELLEIKGVPFKPQAYRQAAKVLENLEKDISDVYNAEGDISSKTRYNAEGDISSKTRYKITSKFRL